jgi:hypothetical protein
MRVCSVEVEIDGNRKLIAVRAEDEAETRAREPDPGKDATYRGRPSGAPPKPRFGK